MKKNGERMQKKKKKGCLLIRLTYLFSASYDSTIKVWSVASKNLVTSLVSHKGKVNQVSYTKKDNLLLSAGNDMAVKLWDVNSGKHFILFSLPAYLPSYTHAHAHAHLYIHTYIHTY